MKTIYNFYMFIVFSLVIFPSQIHSTHLLFTWGRNEAGQLGDGTRTNRNYPVLIGSDTNWSKIYINQNILFCIKSNGTLWGCGGNDYGQLGDGTTTFRITLTQIGNDSNWSMIANATWFTLGLKTNGTLWSWGDNSSGELGDSTTTNRLSPVRIGLDSNWVYMAAGGYMSSLGIKSDGSLWGWGYNSGIALDSSYNSLSTLHDFPFRINGWSNWQKISSGQNSSGLDNSLALTESDSLYGWGGNNFGELAHYHTYHITAVPIDSARTMTWRDMVEGSGYTLAISSDGSLWACGKNLTGQLGDGTSTERDTLVRIGNDTTWVKVFASNTNSGQLSFGMKRNGSLWTWGNGRFGNGNTSPIYTPVQLTNISRIVEFSSNGNSAAIIDVLPPTLRVNSFTNIDRYSAIAHYQIDTLSTPALLTTTATIARGICWDTLPNPDTSKAHTAHNGNFTIGSYTDSLSGLLMGRTYHVRAYATTVAGTGYSQDTTFTTKSYQLIPLQQGWNMISTYINPDTTDFWVLCQPISQHVVVGKNSAGQFYVPSLGINYIYNWQYNQAYQFYMNAVDTLRIDGLKFVPDSTPIYLSPGWGMISYLRNSPMAIDSALSSISSSFLIVKNGTGQFYIPSMYINTIGNMIPGQGYQIYMLENGVLYYPRNW